MKLLTSIACVVILTLAAPAESNPGSARIIHAFVALADNANQGIVPVPAKLGNGFDPERNLYWGSAFGVKTFFARSNDWTIVAKGLRPKDDVLERCVFKHHTQNVYLIADAYRGDRIKQAISDFFDAAGGESTSAVSFKEGQQDRLLKAGGDADVIVYVGHDGLMDFQLDRYPRKQRPGKRRVFILACASKQYFGAELHETGADPLLWTTNLMAPEAYTLKSALDGWIQGESDEQVRERAAQAYDHYQRCGIKGARRLLVTGW
jgi:hypothetical protein